MGLPWPTHRLLLDTLSGEKHVWVRIIGRFILKIKKKKMILITIMSTVKDDARVERKRTEQWSWIILEMPEHCLFNLFRLRCLWTEVSICASMSSLANLIIHLCSAEMLWYCINSTSSQTRTSNFALFVIIIIFLRFHPVIDLMSWLESSSVQALSLSMKLSNFLIKSSWHAPRRSAVLPCIYAS